MKLLNLTKAMIKTHLLAFNSLKHLKRMQDIIINSLCQYPDFLTHTRTILIL